jgi:hypothetical protein
VVVCRPVCVRKAQSEQHVEQASIEGGETGNNIECGESEREKEIDPVSQRAKQNEHSNVIGQSTFPCVRRTIVGMWERSGCGCSVPVVDVD